VESHAKKKKTILKKPNEKKIITAGDTPNGTSGGGEKFPYNGRRKRKQSPFAQRENAKKMTYLIEQVKESKTTISTECGQVSFNHGLTIVKRKSGGLPIVSTKER